MRAARRLTTRQARWAMFFTRFVFTLTYRPGSKNVGADALSRQHDTEERPVDDAPMLPESCIVALVVWELDADIARAQRDEPSPPTCPEGRTYVPASVRDRLIYWAHTSASSGHPGIGPTVRALAGKYWWPTLAKDVRVYVSSCSVCAQSKAPRHLPVGKLHPLPIPQRPWSHLSVDFLTDLPPSQGHTTILVVVDRFSKSCRLLPLPGLPTALQTAEALVTHVFRHYGVPEDIVSDWGHQFTSRVWKAFMQHLGISVSLTSGYHPQSNGQVERVNQEVGRFLRSYCQDRPGEWAEFLPWAEYAVNFLHHSSTGMSPFQCVLGYQPVLAPWTPSQTGTPAVDDWFRRAAGTWEAVQARLRLTVCRQKIFADRHRREAPVYRPGDRVWLSSRNLPLRLPCRKLAPRFVGRVNAVTYRLRLPPTNVLTPRFMCLSSGRWWLVPFRGVRCGRSVSPPPRTSRGPRRTPSAPSLTRGAGRGASSTSWSGRGTARRSGAGFR
uniref:Gypsy retrotransposon integrase-like protein 1 n=1 Tax=Esox lucius TaxID=8010 RepID=A0AAY5KNP0_ESOLU